MSQAQDFSDFTEVANNPAAQRAMEQMLSSVDSASDPGPAPKISAPAPGFARLPRGVKIGDKTIREVEVTELTGESEERLAKASTSDDKMKYYNVLLEEGTPDQIDGLPKHQVLDKMLVGDREALLLAIRVATYGSEIETPLQCPGCNEVFLGVVKAEDIPVHEGRGDEVFEVPLRKGGKARVRLPNGADQSIYLRDDDITNAERNTLTLTQCIQTLPMNGEDTPVAGFPSLVRGLGIVDRNTILGEIDDRSAGPRYDRVVVTHDECETEVRVPIGMMSLFPGL